MAWRGLHISNPARLFLRDKRLVVSPEQGAEFSIALEDVSYVVLDTPQVSMTAALLAACASADCLVMCSDARHLPNGALLPFHGYHRQAETVRSQMGLSLPRMKRMWRDVVRAKIENQARALEILGKGAGGALRSLRRKVRSGDADNIEALAARRYWQAYQQQHVRRPRNQDRGNALLDYGYAVVRGCLARNLAAYGFWPSLGIHHKSDTNPFNLADDLMEPFRPLVDVRAYRLLEGAEKAEMDLADRRSMVLTLHDEVLLEQARMTCVSAMRRYVELFREGIVRRGGRFSLEPLLPVLPLA